jgi:hypothetical protein
LDETIWVPTSPRVKRISGLKNFRSSPQKDFCNQYLPIPDSSDTLIPALKALLNQIEISIQD